MNSWFECKVKYDKEIEGGMQKTVSEPYMVDALSFTEAESRILEEMRPFISGEFTVANIKRVKISELFLMSRVIGGTNAKSISSPSTRKAVSRNVPLLI